MKGKFSIRKTAHAISTNVMQGVTQYDSLVSYLEQKGWRVVKMQNGESLENTFRLLHLTEYANGKQSFAFQSPTTKLVAIDQSLASKDQTYLLAHELGHIELKHKLGNLGVDEEREANVFAEAYLSTYSRKRGRWFMLAAAVLSCLVAASGITFGMMGFWHLQAAPTTPVVNVSPAPTVYSTAVSNKKVVVTKSGDKYHRPDCIYVESKNNTQEMTVQQAVASGKEPCSVCKP